VHIPLDRGSPPELPSGGAMVLLLCALDFLFEHVAVSVGVTLGQISTYL
jgi:hypothetical protein